MCSVSDMALCECWGLSIVQLGLCGNEHELFSVLVVCVWCVLGVVLF